MYLITPYPEVYCSPLHTLMELYRFFLNETGLAADLQKGKLHSSCIQEGHTFWVRNHMAARPHCEKHLVNFVTYLPDQGLLIRFAKNCLVKTIH